MSSTNTEVVNDRQAMLLLLRHGVAFSAFFACLTILVLAPYRYLLRSVGEELSANEICELSAKEKVLWSSGFLSAGTHLKKPMIEKQQATILAVGSSRTMQFRTKMFSRIPEARFYTVGGAVQNAVDLDNCIQNVLAARPQLIILGLDFWWFQAANGISSDDLIRDVSSSLTETKSIRETLDGYNRAFRLKVRFSVDRLQMYQQAWNDPRFHERLWAESRLDDATGRVKLGCKKTGGFRNDGSYRYSALIDQPFTPDQIAAQGEALVQAGKYVAAGVDQAACVRLARFLHECRKGGIEVVTLLPPIESRVLRQLQAEDVGGEFWKQWPFITEQICGMTGHEFYDCSNPELSGISSQQFVDWLHAADTGHASLLAQICESTPASALNQYVDAEQLRADVINRVSELDLYGD